MNWIRADTLIFEKKKTFIFKGYKFYSYGCVRGDIRVMDANATNAVLEANSATALANSMNDPSVALVAFNQRDIFVEVKLM